MKFDYQIHKADVPFFTWVKLCFCVVSLARIRLFRFFKRAFTYLRRYIPIIGCVLIFEVLVIPLGMHLGKYTSWIDGLWDLRVFFLTSILISFFGGVVQEEINRHKMLIKQYDVYQEFMNESSRFIRRLCLLAEFEFDFDLFMNKEQYDGFLALIRSKISDCEKSHKRKVKELPMIADSHFGHSTGCVKPNVYIKIAFERYLNSIDILNKEIHCASFIGTMEHAVRQLDGIYEDIQKENIQIDMDAENYTELQLLRFTECVCRCIYPAIADIRRPWRWDLEINAKMQKIIKQ